LLNERFDLSERTRRQADEDDVVITHLFRNVLRCLWVGKDLLLRHTCATGQRAHPQSLDRFLVVEHDAPLALLSKAAGHGQRESSLSHLWPGKDYHVIRSSQSSVQSFIQRQRIEKHTLRWVSLVHQQIV